MVTLHMQSKSRAADRKLAVETSRPTPSEPLLAVRLHLLNVPQSYKTA